MTSTAAPARPVSVRTARGDLVQVTPGLLDDNARRLFTNGQCLALAVTLAQQAADHGLDAGVTALIYGLDTDSPGIQHCWATVGRSWYDVNGETDPASVRERLAAGEFSDTGDDDATDFYEYPLSDLTQCLLDLSGWVAPQRYDLARSLAPTIWSETLAGRPWSALATPI